MNFTNHDMLARFDGKFRNASISQAWNTSDTFAKCGNKLFRNKKTSLLYLLSAKINILLIFYNKSLVRISQVSSS